MSFPIHPEMRRLLNNRDIDSVSKGKGKGNGKGKGHSTTGHEGPEGEQKYSSTISLTSVLDGGGWSAPRPGRFTPGKETRYPLHRRMGGPHGRSGRVWKISPTSGFDPRIVQPVASLCTGYAIPAHNSVSKQTTNNNVVTICTTNYTFVYLTKHCRLSANSCSTNPGQVSSHRHNTSDLHLDYLAEICDFPQSLHATPSIVLQIWPRPLPSRSFSMNYTL